LFDVDVAEIYGVETKRINEAVKNNLDKFPQDYLLEVSNDEKDELVENFDRFNRLKHSTAKPKAFTEKGLYMVATILKSDVATQTTLAIIEPLRCGSVRGSLPFRQPLGRHERARGRQTFTRIRQLSRNLKQLNETESEAQQKALMRRIGEIIGELFDDELALGCYADHLRSGTAWGSLQNAA
jgi:2-oxo-4-hydroxy-4-carboxy--5-ureidoimidazoline (OHCU) decarboxylase